MGDKMLFVLIGIAFMIVLLLHLGPPPALVGSGYGVVRELLKVQTVLGAWEMDKMFSEHFGVWFAPEKRAEAELILEVAEQVYFPVRDDFDYSPRGKIPIILYSTAEELNKSFGWEAKGSAMGVYWAGAIRVLSPSAWAGDITLEQEQVRKKFIDAGPMAHELTHLMVDYLTGGNYPRWFTEGVAQYEDYKLTGFMIPKPVSAAGGGFYSFAELETNFDHLPDQVLAYWQSWSLIDFIVQTHGEDALHALIAELGRGKSLSAAMESVLHTDLEQYTINWQENYILN